MTEFEKQKWLAIAEQMADTATPMVESEIAYNKQFYEHTLRVADAFPEGVDKRTMLQMCADATDRITGARIKLQRYSALVDYLKTTDAADITTDVLVEKMSNL